MCSECQPSLIRCPICDIKYRSCLTRDFFAEKLLEHLERRCRYQHFGCEMSHKDSGQLGEHEAECEHKPEQPVTLRRKKREEVVGGEEEEVEVAIPIQIDFEMDHCFYIFFWVQSFCSVLVSRIFIIIGLEGRNFILRVGRDVE